jgi:hypothetical protein
MTYHALTYKHKCHGGPEAKCRRRLVQLDARIEQRILAQVAEPMEETGSGEEASE